MADLSTIVTKHNEAVITTVKNGHKMAARDQLVRTHCYINLGEAG